MNVIIHQEHVSFADIFNVKWKDEVSESCHSLGVMGLQDKSIQWNNTKNQAIEWTDEKVDQVFGDCCPKGLDHEIMSILDKGYSIFVSDNGMHVRQIWIEKVDENNKSIEEEEQKIFGRAPQFEAALKTGISIFRETLAKGQPFKYDEWFGEDKKYSRFVVGEQVADSRLDGFFALATHMMAFRKNEDHNYELEFSRKGMKKSTIISCKKFTIA